MDKKCIDLSFHPFFADSVDTSANALRIQNIERCFGSNGEPLYKEGRILIGEGILTKICRKYSRPRQVFLFNDILVSKKKEDHLVVSM